MTIMITLKCGNTNMSHIYCVLMTCQQFSELHMSLIIVSASQLSKDVNTCTTSLQQFLSTVVYLTRYQNGFMTNNF